MRNCSVTGPLHKIKILWITRNKGPSRLKNQLLHSPVLIDQCLLPIFYAHKKLSSQSVLICKDHSIYDYKPAFCINNDVTYKVKLRHRPNIKKMTLPSYIYRQYLALIIKRYIWRLSNFPYRTHWRSKQWGHPCGAWPKNVYEWWLSSLWRPWLI